MCERGWRGRHDRGGLCLFPLEAGHAVPVHLGELQAMPTNVALLAGRIQAGAMAMNDTGPERRLRWFMKILLLLTPGWFLVVVWRLFR